MTKFFNFALKIKGGDREGGTCEVLRPCHPPKFETCTSASCGNFLQRYKDWNGLGRGRYSNWTRINAGGQNAATIQVIPWAIIEVGPGALGQILHPPGDHKWET